MPCFPFLKPEERRDPVLDKGAEITNGFYIRLASLYPDLERGWHYNFFSFYQYVAFLGYVYYVTAYIVATYHAIQWMDVQLIGETLCFGIITYVCCIVLIVFTLNRDKINKLLIAAGKGTYVYDRPMMPDELAIKNSMEEEARNYGKRAFGIPLGVAIVQMFVIPLQNGLRGKYTSIVFNETAPINKYSPLPVWTPYEATDAKSFFILFPFQLFPGMVEFFIVHAGITFFVGCSCVLIKDLKLFLKSTGDMYDRAVYMFEKRGHVNYGRKRNFENPEFQKCMRACLRENIEHHISILNFFVHFDGILGWTILAIFAGAAVQISTPPYTIVKVAEMGDTEELLTTGTMMMGHAILSLFLTYKYCAYGQLVIALSDEILQAYYDTPWQECDIKFRKMLIVAMSNSQKPIVPKAQVIGVPASLATLLDLIRQSYSLFSLLLTTE